MPMDERQKARNIAYNRSRDAITLRPSKEEGAKIRQAAEAAGQPLQQYVLDAVRERMKTEQQG